MKHDMLELIHAGSLPVFTVLTTGRQKGNPFLTRHLAMQEVDSDLNILQFPRFAALGSTGI